jgi:hypothetical protein
VNNVHNHVIDDPVWPLFWGLKVVDLVSFVSNND